MRIKLAILDKDKNYLSRIVTAFSTKYADKFEIYSFTDQAVAITALESSRIDVFIASDSYDIDFSQIPKRCGFAYFVDSTDLDMVNDQRAICKFQRADLIYKQILSLYSEKASSLSGVKLGDDSAKILVFSSPCGGVGTSSVAAAVATYFSSKGAKTLYLNLEKFGSSDPIFEAEGLFSMSDIIYALKSKKANLSMKLESCVKQDKSGVFFFSQTKVALDMLELTFDDIERLINEIKFTGSYEYIIVDAEFSMSKEMLKFYRKSHALVWVSDGTEIANIKVQRAFNALTIIDQNAESSVLNRLCLIYNKFSNKTGKTVGDIGIRNIGGAPVYMHASTKQVVDQLSTMTFYDNII